MVRVRLARLKGGAFGTKSLLDPGRVLGEVEEYFIEQLMPGDSFVFAGEILRFEGLRELDAIVTRAHATELNAERARRLLAEPGSWSGLPNQVSDWLRCQADVSIVPGPDEILVETFPRGHKHYLVCYPFEGRLAHQSLGMLLTRRLERAGAALLGFVANEYALAIWALNDMGERVKTGRLDLAKLFDEATPATTSTPGSQSRA
jgi:ATP-dependent Lhr-like helicase